MSEKPDFGLSYALEKLGDSPCSSLMVLCTRGVHAGGEETLMPPLGRVQSSEEVLTRTCTVSIGGMNPRLTTNTVLSRSSSIRTCPADVGDSIISFRSVGRLHTPEKPLPLAPWRTPLDELQQSRRQSSILDLSLICSVMI